MRHRRPRSEPVTLPADLFDLTYDGPCLLPAGACANPSECGRREECLHAPVAKSISRAPAHGQTTSYAGFAAQRRAGKRKGLRGAAAAERSRHLAAASARVESGEWEGAGANELVALCAVLHRHVYGVEDGDLQVPREWALAAVAAARFRDEQFRGDVVAVVGFLRWAWAREEHNERRRRESGSDARRLGWRLLFSTRIVTDYRLALARGTA